jgi:hypothetical protein
MLTRLAPLVALLATACAPAVLQTARTNGKGNFQFAVEPGLVGASAAGSTGVAPTFNLSGRYGVSDSVDLGLRLGTSLYELQGKFLFTDPADTDGVALALAPSTTVFGGGISTGDTKVGGFYWGTRIPLLIGVPVGRSELTIGPRLSPIVFGAGGGAEGVDGSSTAFALMAGASVGFAGRAADKFRIMPEVGIDVPLIGGGTASVGGTSTSSTQAFSGAVTFNAGLGLMFGGSDN